MNVTGTDILRGTFNLMNFPINQKKKKKKKKKMREESTSSLMFFQAGRVPFDDTYFLID